MYVAYLLYFSRYNWLLKKLSFCDTFVNRGVSS